MNATTDNIFRSAKSIARAVEQQQLDRPSHLLHLLLLLSPITIIIMISIKNTRVLLRCYSGVCVCVCVRRTSRYFLIAWLQTIELWVGGGGGGSGGSGSRWLRSSFNTFLVFILCFISFCCTTAMLEYKILSFLAFPYCNEQ